MTKILFVDDRTKRIKWAWENYKAPEWELTLATNVPEALRHMVKEEFGIISLDHDLNGHDFQDPETETCGMEIVRYIVQCGGWHNDKIPEFWIHSSNLFAAHLMITTLLQVDIYAYYKPITYKIENMQYDEKGIPLP